MKRSSGGKIGASRNRRQRDETLPILEPLDRRIMLAVTATFAAAAGQLTVIGDDLNNTITISRGAGGTILVNNGAIPIQGGVPTVANTSLVRLFGEAGDDSLSLIETDGILPPAMLFGGAGNDTLTGGSGDDFVEGEAGNDNVSLGAGDDSFVWNPGDGSDVVEGQGGQDTFTFNGSDAVEKFDLAADGGRAILTRDVGAVTMNLGGVERVRLDTFGGADAVNVNDLTGSGVTAVDIDLDDAAGTGFGDNTADSVAVNGTAGNDAVQIASSGTRIAVTGLATAVNITGEDGLDALAVNTLGGNDQVDASNLAATNASQLIKLTETGGAGNDTLTGSQGADTFVWNPGDGSDTIDGRENPDTLIFTGSDLAEQFGLTETGSHVHLTRDIGSVVMDLGGIETITINALGGADTVTAADLSNTPLVELDVNLNATIGPPTVGDGQPDSVTVNGRDTADLIPIIGRAGVIVVDGGYANGTTLPYFTVIRAVEADDSLRVNGNGGNDTVNVDLENRVNLQIDGGAGTDTFNVTSSNANSFATILPGTGDDAVNVNTDGAGVANARFADSQQIGALIVGNGGSATVAAGAASVLTTGFLDVAPTGTLDLNDNTLVVDYSDPSPIANIASLIRRGYDGGDWNGSGITTGLGNASKFGLGFAEASDVPGGPALAGSDGTAVIVKFTLYGDANLDGKVDFNDLVRLAQHYNTPATTWAAGDFSYDSATDFNDLVRLAQNYNTALPAIPPNSRLNSSRAFSVRRIRSSNT